MKRTPIDLPENNPTSRLGTPLPAEGENGLFSQSWFPVCMSEEVGPGQVRGERFLDGKVVVFRGEDGQVRVMSAYCPHLGADLSFGRVVDNALQCPFHKWEYDGSGRCRKTWIGDPAPPTARLYKFPVQERYGVVWAFNGEKPLWDIPNFSKADEDIEIRVFRGEDLLNCDPWVFCANTPDMQHLKVLHGFKFLMPDPHQEVEWDEYGLRYKILGRHQGDVPFEWTLGIRGTTLFWQEGPYDGFWFGAMVAFAIPVVGKHRTFAIIALERGDGSPEAEAERQRQWGITEHLMYRTFGEDLDVLNNIHYRPGALTKGDTSLARYLNLLRKYPRAHPSAPFIR